MAVTSVDIAWMAGLLEGEAHFGVRRQHGTKGQIYYQPCIQVVMTDREPLEKLAKLMKVKVANGWKRDPAKYKPIYRVNIYGTKAFGLTQSIYGLMCPRRQEKIREMWAAQKLRRSYKAREV